MNSFKAAEMPSIALRVRLNGVTISSEEYSFGHFSL